MAGLNAVSSASNSGLTGNTLAILFIQSGICSCGTKIPEMKSIGSATKFAIAGAAFSDGTKPENAKPTAESDSTPTNTDTTNAGSVSLGQVDAVEHDADRAQQHDRQHRDRERRQRAAADHDPARHRASPARA